MARMDTGVGKAKELKPHHKGMDTRDLLAHARKQGDKRKLDDYFIVDVDAHHFENQSGSEPLASMPTDVRWRLGRSSGQARILGPRCHPRAPAPRHQPI